MAEEEAMTAGYIEIKNYKGLLNQYCQKKKIGPPVFETLAIEEGRIKGFQSHVLIAVTKFDFSGIHPKKKQAENEAARVCLESLGFLDDGNLDASFDESMSVKVKPENSEKSTVNKNPKSTLNEFCQKMKIPAAQYETTECTDGPKLLGYTCVVTVRDIPYSNNTIFSSKREAEHCMAAKALNDIKPNAATAFDSLIKSPVDTTVHALYNSQGISYKNLLQEHLNQRNFDNPVYETKLTDEGYQGIVTVEGKLITSEETFSSKKSAEQCAAKAALIDLGVKDPESVAVHLLRRRSKGQFRIPAPLRVPGPFRTTIPKGNESETWIHTRTPVDFDSDNYDETGTGYTDFQLSESPYFQKRSLDLHDGATPNKRQKVGEEGHVRRRGGFLEVADVHLGNLTVGEIWAEKRNVVIVGSAETSIPLYCNGERGRCALEETKTSTMIDIQSGHRLVGLEGHYIERGGQIALVARKCDEIIMPEEPDKVLVSCGVVVMHCIPRKTEDGNSCDMNILLKRYLCSQAFVNVVRGMAQFFRNELSNRAPKIDRPLLTSNVSKWMLEEVMAVASMSEDALRNVFRHTMKFDRRWGLLLTAEKLHEDLKYMQDIASEELARRANSQEDQNQDRFRPWRLPKGNFHHRILSTGVFVESPAECAKRELREETGIRLKLNDIAMSPYVDIPQDDNLNPHKGDVSRYFLCGIITEDESLADIKKDVPKDETPAMSESFAEEMNATSSSLDQSSSSLDGSLILSPSVYGALHEECTWYDVDPAREISDVFKEVYNTDEFQSLMENLKRIVTEMS